MSAADAVNVKELEAQVAAERERGKRLDAELLRVNREIVTALEAQVAAEWVAIGELAAVRDGLRRGIVALRAADKEASKP